MYSTVLYLHTQTNRIRRRASFPQKIPATMTTVKSSSPLFLVAATAAVAPTTQAFVAPNPSHPNPSTTTSLNMSGKEIEVISKPDNDFLEKKG